jgi:hypothetical protein
VAAFVQISSQGTAESALDIIYDDGHLLRSLEASVAMIQAVDYFKSSTRRNMTRVQFPPPLSNLGLLHCLNSSSSI